MRARFKLGEGMIGRAAAAGAAASLQDQVDGRALSEPPRVEGFLMVSALVPYKRVDLAITATERAGVPLTIVGDGPERAQLEAMGGKRVRFLGWASNDQIRDLYRSTIATILPGEEDFGIVPLEAQACGRPVVALGVGGACETVIDGENGFLVPPRDVDALTDALLRFVRDPTLAVRMGAASRRLAETKFDAREVNRALLDAMGLTA